MNIIVLINVILHNTPGHGYKKYNFYSVFASSDMHRYIKQV